MLRDFTHLLLLLLHAILIFQASAMDNDGFANIRGPGLEYSSYCFILMLFTLLLFLQFFLRLLIHLIYYSYSLASHQLGSLFIWTTCWRLREFFTKAVAIVLNQKKIFWVFDGHCWRKNLPHQLNWHSGTGVNFLSVIYCTPFQFKCCLLQQTKFIIILTAECILIPCLCSLLFSKEVVIIFMAKDLCSMSPSRLLFSFELSFSSSCQMISTFLTFISIGRHPWPTVSTFIYTHLK